MTASGKIHCYQVTNYQFTEAQAEREAKKHEHSFIHFRIMKNGKRETGSPRTRKYFAVLIRADDKSFEYKYGQSKLFKLSEIDEVV